MRVIGSTTYQFLCQPYDCVSHITLGRATYNRILSQALVPSYLLMSFGRASSLMRALRAILSLIGAPLRSHWRLYGYMGWLISKLI